MSHTLQRMPLPKLEVRRAHWQRRAEAAQARADRLHNVSLVGWLTAWLRARECEDALERVEAEIRYRHTMPHYGARV